MKILAHSVVPINPVPYMHLGYVSAVPFSSVGQSLTGTLILAVISLYLLLSIKRKVTKIIGACLLAGALYLSFISIRYYQINTPRYFTGVYGRIAINHISADPDIHKMMSKDYNRYKFDGWHREFKVMVRKTKQGEYRCLTSAGPDGIFDTADDMHIRQSPGRKVDFDFNIRY